MQDFLQSAVSSLSIGSSSVQLGVVQSDQQILLSSHRDRASLLAAVKRLRYAAGAPGTARALQLLLRSFSQEAGGRGQQRVPQLAVLLTDGASRDNLQDAARRLQQTGVLVLVVAVGQEQDLQRLQAVASPPWQLFLVQVRSYEALQTQAQTLLQTVCRTMEYQRHGEPGCSPHSAS